jgi:hypothetical protein
VEAVDLPTGPWAGFPFACAGRGADPAPDSGPGALRLMACSIEPPESDESNSLALRLPALARGAFWYPAHPPPPHRQSRFGAYWTGQHMLIAHNGRFRSVILRWIEFGVVFKKEGWLWFIFVSLMVTFLVTDERTVFNTYPGYSGVHHFWYILQYPLCWSCFHMRALYLICGVNNRKSVFYYELLYMLSNLVIIVQPFVQHSLGDNVGFSIDTCHYYFIHVISY